MRIFAPCMRLPFLLVFLILTPSVSAQQPDSSTLSREPVFSHQYRLNNQGLYRFIDTNFRSMQWYHRLNNTLRDEYGYLVLTNQGGPRNRILLPEAAPFWQYFGLGPFEGHFTHPQEIPYYQTRSPLTEAGYVQGYNRGQTFVIRHTQNVHPRWNFHLRYKRMNSLGFYQNNQNKQSSFLANSHYQSPDQRYLVKGFLLTEEMENQEFGGIANDSVFTENLETNRELLLTNLSDDTRFLRNRMFGLDQSYALLTQRPDTSQSDSAQASRESGPQLRLGYAFEYQRRSMVYAGSSEDYYANYFFTNAPYRDSVAYHHLRHYAYTQFALGANEALLFEGGLNYFQYRYLNDDFAFQANSLGLSAKLEGHWRDRYQLSGHLDYALTGPLQNTFSLDAQIRTPLPGQFFAFAGYGYQRQYPELYLYFYRGNNFLWDNNFDPYVRAELRLGLQWPGGSFVARNFQQTQRLYFNQEGQPQAAGTTVRYTQFDLSQNFCLWNFLHQDNRATYQGASSGADFLPLPEWVNRHSLYFRFRLFKRALQVMTGAELNYFSAFQSQAYNPALGRFQLQEELRIGDYPYLDLFAQFKVGKAQIFVRLQHLNQGWNGYRYFAAPAYPLNDRVFRAGINWRFFN